MLHLRTKTVGLLLFFSLHSAEMMKLTSVTLHNVTDTLTRENEQFAAALLTAADAFRDAESIFTEPGFDERKGWKADAQNNDGDVVYARYTKNGKMVAIKGWLREAEKKVASLQTELPMDVDSVMQETWNGVPGLPDWNTHINFASVVATLTPYADVCNYGNNDVLIVSGREFLSSRLYRKVDSHTYIMASRSFDIDSIPVREGKVRAWVHLAAARFRAHPNDPNKTVTDVLTCVDLKGLLPKFVINQMLGKLMLLDTEANKKHFKDLADKRANATAPVIE